MASVSNDLKVLDGGLENTKKEPVERGSKQWADKLRKDTAKLAKQLDTGYMALGEKLWLIYDTPIDGDPTRSSVCTAWQDKEGNYYTSFAKYVEAELEIHYKKATRLLSVWKTFKIDLQLNDRLMQRVTNLGFSKIRELVRPGVLSSKNIEAWVTKAEVTNVIKLQAGVTKYLTDKATEESTKNAEAEFEREYNGSLASAPSTSSSSISGETIAVDEAKLDEKRIEALEVQSRQFSCILFGDQIETVNLAMRRSIELSNSDKVGHNLSLICLDFLATNDFRFDDEDQKLRFLAKFERLLGYKLVVVDPVASEVLYGISTLEKLAKSED